MEFQMKIILLLFNYYWGVCIRKKLHFTEPMSDNAYMH